MDLTLGGGSVASLPSRRRIESQAISRPRSTDGHDLQEVLMRGIFLALVAALTFSTPGQACTDYDRSLTVLGHAALSGSFGLISYDVEVSGDHAYVAHSGFGLDIVDISNPSSPQTIGHFQTTETTQTVAVSGHYAFV